MSTLFTKEVWDALFHGVVAGVLVLVLNGIGHYVFEAPAIPFAHGLAVALAVIVTAIQLIGHPHGDTRIGA
jgi:hypothetical protein